MGLGAALADEILVTTDATMRHPFVLKRYEHPALPTAVEFRTVQLARFSEYGVVYAVVGLTFWIVAIAHAKRRPSYWIDRVADLA